MSDHKIPVVAGLAAAIFATLVFIGGEDAIAESGTDKIDYTSMSPEALAEHLIFAARGFNLDQETQEGGTVRQRLVQDELQKTCSALRGARPEGDTATRVIAMAREAITYPEGGIALGDWKKGEALARSGFGFRVGHNIDDHSDREPGGNCYACHQLDPDEIAYGTLGPSLTAYGKTRGTGEAMLKYTYEVIYSPHSYFPCTKMPRFGANGFLSLEQIADIMAYVMHPESPVNQ
jgi:sulfur-oxidizing protein SoxX